MSLSHVRESRPGVTRVPHHIPAGRQKWVDEGIAKTVWISGFFFPQAFMTSILQAILRDYKNKIVFFMLLSYQKDLCVIVCALPAIRCECGSLFSLLSCQEILLSSCAWVASRGSHVRVRVSGRLLPHTPVPLTGSPRCAPRSPPPPVHTRPSPLARISRTSFISAAESTSRNPSYL